MKVKIFGAKANSVSCRAEVEQQLNEFISTVKVVDIKYQVIKNYLPQTTQAEYEELWYCMVLYEE